MALNTQIASTPAYSDFPFMNFGVTDIPAGTAVAIDAANTVGSGQQGIGIVLPTTDGAKVVGVTLDKISAGTSGRVRCPTPLAMCKADGAITANTYVMSSGTSGKLGHVKTYAAGAGVTSLGIALTTATNGDEVLVMLVLSPALPGPLLPPFLSP